MKSHLLAHDHPYLLVVRPSCELSGLQSLEHGRRRLRSMLVGSCFTRNGCDEGGAPAIHPLPLRKFPSNPPLGSLYSVALMIAELHPEKCREGPTLRNALSGVAIAVLKSLCLNDVGGLCGELALPTSWSLTSVI